MRLTCGVRTCAVMLVLAGCEHIRWFEKERATTTAPAKRVAAADKESIQSLVDRLGGDAAIRAVVDDFVPRALADDRVNFTRRGTPREWQATPQNVAKFKERMVEFIGVATGGPQKYEGQDMGTAHKGMKITDAEFDALAHDLKISLEKLNVPARENKELLEIVGSARGVIVEKQ